MGERPRLEFFRNLNSHQKSLHLFEKLFLADRFLMAMWFPVTAVVIPVAKESRIDHVLQQSFAARASFPLAISKLKAAIVTNYLMLFFRRNRALALTATNESREGEFKV